MFSLLLAAVAVTAPIGAFVDTLSLAPTIPAVRADTLARNATIPDEPIDVVTPASPMGSRRLASPFALASGLVADTTRPRRVAVEYSDAYATRLTIHRVASYAMLPLFGAEYLLGQKLLDNSTSSTRNQHALAAGAVATLFGVNTITGVWNWWDARNDENDRTRRTVHTVLMLAADAGFAATGILANSASGSHDKALTHRNVAIGSMGIATIGTAIMWFWKD